MKANQESAEGHDGARVFARLLDVWGTGEVSRLPALLHSDYTGHILHLEYGERDAATYPGRIQAYRSANPNVVFTVDDQLSSGDRVCTRLSARRSDPESGAAQAAHGINISRYEGGLLIEE